MKSKTKYLFIILTMLFSFSALAQGDLSADVEDNTARIDELEEILEIVETDTLKNRLNFGFDFRVTMNNYLMRDNSTPETLSLGLLTEKKDETFNLWNIRGRLKMTSWIGEDIKLIAWISAYKNFMASRPSDGEESSLYTTWDSSRGYWPESSDAYMERMVLDWFMTDWLAFTIGRGYTSEGTPYDTQFNTVSLGTFSSAAFNRPIDGFYFTMNLNHLLGMKNSYFRVGFTPFHTLDATNGDNLYISDKGVSNYFLAHLDVEIPGLPGSKVQLLSTIAPQMLTTDRNIERAKVLEDGTVVNELLTLKAPDKGDSLGSLMLNNITLSFPNAFDTGFDFYASGSMTLLNPATITEDTPTAGYLGLEEKDEETGDVKRRPILTTLGSNLSGKPILGWMFLVGLRYNTPLRMAGDWFKIGADFNMANDKFIFYSNPDTTGHNRYLTRGMYGDVYTIIPIHVKASFKIGYIYQHFNNPYGFMFQVGQGVPEIDETVHNVYGMLNAYF